MGGLQKTLPFLRLDVRALEGLQSAD